MSATATAPARRRSNELLSHPVVKGALPFLNGGAAGMMATSIIQPIDMVKVRLQLAGEGAASKSTPRPSAISVTRQIIAQGRFLDLYSGLSAGLLRQAVYTTARMGFFGTFMSRITTTAAAENRPITFSERAMASLAAGGLGAILGNPADLALIRMQSDGLRPVAERQNYTSVFNALGRITKSEGITALWAGCMPTVMRAMALNFGQLAFYSEAKQRLKGVAPGGAAGEALGASAVAGFFASFFSLPFDFVKTRLQRGKGRYKGTVDCVVKVVKEEGPLRFYRGFGTYYVRIAPHAALTVLFADALGLLSKTKQS